MTIKQYIESFGWKLEDCSLDEIREALGELKSIESGASFTDGVLSRKRRRVANQWLSRFVMSDEELRITQRVIRTRGFPLLRGRELTLAVSAGEKAERFFFTIYPHPNDNDFPNEGFAPWFLQLFQ